MASGKITRDNNAALYTYTGSIGSGMSETMKNVFEELPITGQPVFVTFYYEGERSAICYKYATGQNGFIMQLPFTTTDRLIVLVKYGNEWKNRYISVLNA